MKKKLKILFYIAFFLWICYIIKTWVFDGLIGRYLRSKSIQRKYEGRVRDSIEKKDPKSELISLVALGSIYFNDSKNYAKALEQYQKIISEFPGCDLLGYAYCKSGECHEKMGKRELAMAEYRKFLEKTPKASDLEFVELAKSKLKELEEEAGA